MATLEANSGKTNLKILDKNFSVIERSIKNLKIHPSKQKTLHNRPINPMLALVLNF